MLSIKRLILALLSFLLIFLFMSYADITFSVRALTPFDRLSGHRNIIAPTEFSPQPTWWTPPRPTKTPKPTKIPIPPPITEALVYLQAFTNTCGRQNPFSGTFQICEAKSADTLQAISCQLLTTDTRGKGKLSTHPGRYDVRPPFWCPPGAYCIAGGSFGKLQLLDNPLYKCPPGAICIDGADTLGGSFPVSSGRTLIADPYSWNINPQNFFLPPGGTVDVSAVGHNKLLMCPIQTEE